MMIKKAALDLVEINLVCTYVNDNTNRIPMSERSIEL